MKRRVLLKALRERCLRGAYRWGARSFLHSELEWVDALPKVVLQQGRVLALVAATKVLASYIREKYSSSEVKVINVDSKEPGFGAGEHQFDLIIMGPFLHELHEQRRAELFALVTTVARPGAPCCSRQLRNLKHTYSAKCLFGPAEKLRRLTC